MRDSVLYAFIMNVFEGNIDCEFSLYHPLYKSLNAFPKNHAITFMKDYIEHNKCLFIPKLKFIQIIRHISMEYDLNQKTLIKSKRFIDKCILELEYPSITKNTEEKPSNDKDYYDGFY